MVNRNRLTAAMVVLAVCTAFALTAWVDPLEGIVGVFAGIAGTVGVWAISRIRIPIFTVAATALTTILCVAIWVGLITAAPTDAASSSGVTASVPDWIWPALTVYRALAVGMVAGLVMYLVIHLNARKKATGK